MVSEFINRDISRNFSLMRAGFHLMLYPNLLQLDIPSQSLVNEGRFPLEILWESLLPSVLGRNPSLMRAGFHQYFWWKDVDQFFDEVAIPR